MLDSILSHLLPGRFALRLDPVISKPPPAGRAAWASWRWVSLRSAWVCPVGIVALGRRSASATASAFRWLIGQPVRVGGASCSVVKVLAGCARPAWPVSFRLAPAVCGPARGLRSFPPLRFLAARGPVWLAFGVPDCDCIISSGAPIVKPFLQKIFGAPDYSPTGSKKFFRGRDRVRNDPALCVCVIPYSAGHGPRLRPG